MKNFPLALLLQSGKTAARTAANAAKKRNAHLLRWLISLGGMGLFVVAIIDSSVIPLPLPGSSDLLLLLLAAHRGTTAWTAAVLGFSTFAGAIIGGYLTWEAGRKGGEATLERYVPRQMLERVKGWVRRHGAWSVGLAAALPPPVPLTPFVLAAGALGVSRVRFLVSYGLARAFRYSLLAWLGLTYGRWFIRLWNRSLQGYSSVILWAYGGLVVLGILYGVWKFRSAKQAGDQPGAAEPDVA